MSEGATKAAIIVTLNAIPGVYMRNVPAGKVKVRGGWVQLAPKGHSDLAGNVFARAAYLEVKKEGKETTSKQRKLDQAAFLAARKREGCLTGKVDSVAAALKACGLAK